MTRIYEWTWTRPNGATMRTRSTRKAAMFRRAARGKLGGKVERSVAGFRLPSSLARLLNGEVSS